MFDIERVRASWSYETTQIDAIVLPMSAEAAVRPIREDGWSAHDLLEHIANWAHLFVRFIGAHTSPPSSGNLTIQDLNEQQLHRHEQRPWVEVQDHWQRVRDEITAFLAASTNDIGRQPAHLPWRPDAQTAGDVLRLLILHTRSHREELVRGTALVIEE